MERFNIQVEHSENSERHKSNFVEFIARNLIPYLVSVDESNVITQTENGLQIIKTVFRKTSYLDDKDDKFDFVLMRSSSETQVPLEERRLFKTFGPYGNDLF